MKNIGSIFKLIIIRYIHLILLIVAAGFIAFEGNYSITIVIIIISFYVNWKFYRCPYCKYTLDTRLKLNENTHCPECGKVISKFEDNIK